MELIQSRNYPKTFSEMLDTFFNENYVPSKLNTFIPTADISENEKGYSIKVTLPGMDKKDISVEVNDNTFVISGERKFENEKKEGNYHLVESQYGSFKRTFTLPKNASKDKVSANYVNGILEIQVSKDEAKLINSKIEVK